MPYQTSEAWSVFNKRKKELKKSYFGSGNADLKGVNIPMRSFSQLEHSDSKNSNQQDDNKKNAVELQHTTKLESEVSFQELNETSITLTSQKSNTKK